MECVTISDVREVDSPAVLQPSGLIVAVYQPNGLIKAAWRPNIKIMYPDKINTSTLSPNKNINKKGLGYILHIQEVFRHFC